MRIKFKFILALAVLNICIPLHAATLRILTNNEPHVGEQVVLSVETSQIPSNGSVEWSINPTTGQNPAKISLRAGGRECAFTPLDTQPIRVIATIEDRDGNTLNSTEYMVNPQEFKIDVAVVVDKPLTLWDASKRSNYVLSPDILMANTPVRLRAALNPSFKGEHKFQWVSDAATSLLSQDKDDIFIKRGEIGESGISVVAFNASGTKLGSGESVVNITLPVSVFEESSREREAWQSWQKAQELWESKSYAEAVDLAQKAKTLSPRDSDIENGLRVMSANFARFTRAKKLRYDAMNFDTNGLYDDALKNLRSAQVIWPVDDGAAEIQMAEEKVNEQRILQQRATWLRDTASAYDNEGLYEDALESYAKSVALISSDAIEDRMERIRNRLTLIADADRYAGEGNKFEREGKLQEALNHYAASVQSNADAGLRQHIEELQSVISRRERQAAILYREGQDLQKRNNNLEALKRYKESLNLWETDNALQRVRQLERSMRLEPDVKLRGPEDFGIGTKIDAAKIIQAADKLYSQGSFDEAAVLYKKAQAISSSDEIKDWLAKLEHNLRERDAVRNANSMISEANALYKSGKKKEAMEIYRQSLSVHPNAQVEAFIKNQVN